MASAKFKIPFLEFHEERIKVATISAYEILQGKQQKGEKITFCLDLNKITLHTVKINEQYPSTFYEKFYNLFSKRMYDLNYEWENYQYVMNALHNDAICFGFIDVDFGNLFDGICNNENHSNKPTYEALINNGFTIKDAQNDSRFWVPRSELATEDITYKAFLTSSSKVKKHHVIFINEAFQEELDGIFNMGLDISNIPKMNAAKFNAYRGLFLSDGEFLDAKNQIEDLTSKKVGKDFNLGEEISKLSNIDNNLRDHLSNTLSDVTISHTLQDEMDDSVKLSSSSVLILNDEKLEQLADFITAKEKGNSKTEWEIERKYNAPVQFDPFDGEGIISAEMCWHYQVLEMNDTIQLRLPYAKGVLHRFDIHGFIREFFGDTKLYVKDFWGIERDLSKVHIIAGTSFFKCAKWLAPGYHIENPSWELDPLDIYFEYFYKYNYKLLICNTEETFATNTGLTRIGYQILNTLDMPRKEFKEFVYENIHFEDLKICKDNLKDYPNLQRYNIFSTNIYELLKINDNFAGSNKLKYTYKTCIKNELKELSRGRIYIPGERRFLSRDLIAFMYCVLKRATKPDGNKLFELDAIKKQLMPNGYFFAPQMNLEEDQICAIYRDPHLSRNEQVAAKSFVPDDDNIYSRYLGEKSSVCFFPLESLDPLTLGGADFDGDMVSIITENHFVDAVIKGVYNYAEGVLERKVPIELIPGTKTVNEEKIQEHLQLDSLVRSFESKIGIVSNKALRIGCYEYFSKKDDPDYHDKTAFAAILSGLSIDAAKSGLTPSTKEIDALIPKTKKRNYKDLVDLIKPLKINRDGVSVGKGDNYYTVTAPTQSGESTVKIPIVDNDSTNLDYLLNIFCEELQKNQDQGYKISKSKDASTDGALIKLQTKGYYESLINGKVKLIVQPQNDNVCFLFDTEKFSQEFNAYKEGKTFKELFSFLKKHAFEVCVEVVTDISESEAIGIEHVVPYNHPFEKFESSKLINKNYAMQARAVREAKIKFDNFIKTEIKKISNKYHKTLREAITEKVEKDDIDCIIEIFKQYFNQLFETKEELESVWDLLIVSNWKFMTIEERNDFLSSIGIYSTDTVDSDDELALQSDAYNILVDFKKSGYMLLPILLKSCYIDFEISEIISVVEDEIKEVNEKSCNFNKSFYIKLLSKYIAFVKDNSKTTNKFDNMSSNLEKEELESIFNKVNKYYPPEIASNIKVAFLTAAGYNDKCKFVELMGSDFINFCVVNQNQIAICKTPPEYEKRNDFLKIRFSKSSNIDLLIKEDSYWTDGKYNDLWDSLEFETIVSEASKFDMCNRYEITNDKILIKKQADKVAIRTGDEVCYNAK